MILEVKSTKQYDMFKTLPHNRKVNELQVLNLEGSIRKINLTQFNPIMVKDLKVIDGQHRLKACERIGVPVYYVELDTLKDDEIIEAIKLLNNNSKNWSAEDFLNLYCELGYKDYLKVKNFMFDVIDEDKGPEKVLSLSVAISFLSGFTQYKNAVNKSFKEGHFTVSKKDEEKAHQTLKLYKTTKKILSSMYYRKVDTRYLNSSSFIQAFGDMSKEPKFNYRVFLSNLSIMSEESFEAPVVSTDSKSGYYTQLAKVHNNGLTEDFKIKEFYE